MGATDVRTSDIDPSLLADGLQAISYATVSLLAPIVGSVIAPVLYATGVFRLARAGMPRQANGALVLAAALGGAATALGFVSYFTSEPRWCTPAAWVTGFLAISAYAHAMSALVGAFSAPRLAARWRRLGRGSGVAVVIVLIIAFVPSPLILAPMWLAGIYAIGGAGYAQSLTREWVRVCFDLDRVAAPSGK